jgi:hypothetical protein
MVFFPCTHLSCLFLPSVFFIKLIRCCGGYSSRLLMSSSNAFLAASSTLSFPVTPEWLGIHISLTLPFSWSSSSLIRLVSGFFYPSLTFICRHCTEEVHGNHSSLAFSYVNCFDNGLRLSVLMFSVLVFISNEFAEKFYIKIKKNKILKNT